MQIVGDDDPYVKKLSNKTNPCIKWGFRKNYYNIRRCTLSIFHKHNETINIWTHVIGFHIFIFFMIYTFVTNELYAFLGSKGYYDFEYSSTFKDYL